MHGPIPWSRGGEVLCSRATRYNEPQRYVLNTNLKRSMARNDGSQRDGNTPSRVYKSSDVHKRRVDRKGRLKNLPEVQQQPAFDQQVEADSPDQPDEPAVVIAPEFGRRTEAQRKADDRWFAAMREADIDASRAETPGIDAPSADSLQPDAASAGMPSIDAASVGALQSRAPDGETPAQEGANQAGTAPASDAAAPRGGVARPSVSGSKTSATAKAKTDAASVSSDGDKAASASPKDDEVAQKTGRTHNEEPEPDERPSAHAPSKRKLRTVLIVVGVILGLLLVAGILFAWNRWLRFDDHTDMQGEWYVVGTAVPVTIDESSIRLTADVTYEYEINTQDKTIRYKFGPMEGQGRYWFSDDRLHLVITDGDSYTASSTAVDDLLHMFSDLPDKVTGSEVKLPEGEGIIAFSRTPDAEALAKQKSEEAAKAAAEEAARKAAEEEKARREAEEAAEAEYYYYEEEPAGEGAPADGQARGENNGEG